MREFACIAAFVLLLACEKDHYFCPETEVVIETFEINYATGPRYFDYWQTDSAHIEGDSVFYYIVAPPEYDCAYLLFNTEAVVQGDSIYPSSTKFTHVIQSRSKSNKRETKLFSYDISFLDDWFTGDSIGIHFHGDTTFWIDYYLR